MPLLREPLFSVPIYLFVGVWMYKKDKTLFWHYLLLTIIVVAVCDFTSASVLKPAIQRIRPLYDPYFKTYFRKLVDSGGIYSFPSSHASNHFGMAFIWAKIYLKLNNKKIYWPYLWAGIICYAQIYVGKHFFSDIIGGLVLGYTVARLVFGIYVLYINKIQLNRKYEPI